MTWGPRAWGLLAVLAANMFIDAIEVSTVVVAMPSIGRDQGLSFVSMQSVNAAFALGFAGLLLFGSRLVARVGRRRVYLAALVMFAAASVASGLAGGLTVLLACRFVLGLCAALTAPTGIAIIGTAFPAGAVRDRAMSVYAFAGGSGFAGGLVLSGVLTGSAGWRWTLASPAPVVLVLALLGMRFIPREAGAAARPPAARALLRNGRLVRSMLGAACLNGSYLGLLFVLTVQMQVVLGWSPLHTALALLPASAPLMTTSLFSGRLVRRVGSPHLIALGAVPAVAGYLWYLQVGPAQGYLRGVLPVLVLLGAAFVLSFAALNTQAMSAVPPADRPRAGAVYQTAVQVAAAVVPTVVAALVVAPPTGPGEVRAALRAVTAVGAVGLAAALAGLVANRPRPVSPSHHCQEDER